MVRDRLRLNEETEEFINALYEKVKDVEKKNLIDSNRRRFTMHKVLFPIYILNYNKKFKFESQYYNIIISDILEFESLLDLGFYNGAMNLLRCALEALFKLFYYELHPIEFMLHKEDNHILTITGYREFLYIHPNAKKIDAINKEKIETLWKELCAYIHNDIKVLKNISVLSDIKSISEFQENDFQKIIDRTKNVVKIIITVFFLLNNKCMKGLAKAYYDFILDIFEPDEIKNIKEVIGIY